MEQHSEMEDHYFKL